MPARPEWFKRSIDTYNYHAKQLKTNSNWTLRDTSKSLKRSLGSVSEDVMLANWIKEDEAVMKRFESMKEALVFCRKQVKLLRQREI